MLTLTDVNTRQAIALCGRRPGHRRLRLRRRRAVNRGVLPGMPPADDQVFFDYDPAKAKQLLDDRRPGTRPSRCGSSSTSRSPVSSSGCRSCSRTSRRSASRPSSTASRHGRDRVLRQDRPVGRHDRPGRRPGRRAVPRRRSTTAASRPSRPTTRRTSKDCNIDELFLDARRELDPDEAERDLQADHKHHQRGGRQVSCWTTNALSAKVKGLEGVTIPPNTREFIVGVQNWTLTQVALRRYPHDPKTVLVHRPPQDPLRAAGGLLSPPPHPRSRSRSCSGSRSSASSRSRWRRATRSRRASIRPSCQELQRNPALLAGAAPRARPRPAHPGPLPRLARRAPSRATSAIRSSRTGPSPRRSPSGSRRRWR